MKIRIVAFTNVGKNLLKTIVEILENNFTDDILIYDPEKNNLSQWVKDNFYNGNALIFIGATGIATRLIAPHVRSKDIDPAVIVIDEKGKFIIPILSGHIGGANELSNRLAKYLGAVAVITTATDINNKFAVDVWSEKNNCSIKNISDIKKISMAILKDEKIGLYTKFEIFGHIPYQIVPCDKGNIGICLALDENLKPFNTTINVIPKIVTLGVGCKKNTSPQKFEEFILSNLKEHFISLKSVIAISSIDLKKREQCIVKFAEKNNIEFITYSTEELNQVEGDFSSSDFVKKVTGVDNVSERSAVLQSSGKLIIKRIKSDGMTLAVSLHNWRCSF